MHIFAYPCISMHIHAYPCISMHIYAPIHLYMFFEKIYSMIVYIYINICIPFLAHRRNTAVLTSFEPAWPSETVLHGQCCKGREACECSRSAPRVAWRCGRPPPELIYSKLWHLNWLNWFDNPKFSIFILSKLHIPYSYSICGTYLDLITHV